MISEEMGNDSYINHIQAESNLPQRWDNNLPIGHISEAKIIGTKPDVGMSYTNVKTSYTTVILYDQEIKALLDWGDFCSCVSSTYLSKIKPDW